MRSFCSCLSFVWLISLDIMPSGSIHVVTMAGFPSFFGLNHMPFYVCASVCVWLCYHVLYMYSSISWHIGCLPVLTVVNKAIVNIGVQIPFQGRGFVESWSGIARSCDSSIFNFLKNSYSFQHLSPISLIVYILTDVRWHLIVFFICSSLRVSDTQHLFTYLLPFTCLLWKNYSDPLPNFNRIVCIIFTIINIFILHVF